MSTLRTEGDERNARDEEGSLTADATAGAVPRARESAAIESLEGTVTEPREGTATEPREGAVPEPLGSAASTTELDSEPQRKWRPNERLLRALAAARKDLKPGEASLFWDWTRTRDAVPAAELVGSPHGKVIVSNKAAATAYLAPVRIAPASPGPRAATSRIRLRADVDPRRQLTIRVPRPSGSDPVAPGLAAEPVAEPVHRVVAVGYVGTRGERQRRNAVAALLGVFVAVVVFFWLRLPPKKQPGPAVAPRGTPAGLPASPRDPRPLPSLRPPVPGPPAPALSTALPALETPRSGLPALAKTARTAARPTPPGTAPKSEGAAPSPVLPATLRGASAAKATGDADDSFLIRKKGTSSQ